LLFQSVQHSSLFSGSEELVSPDFPGAFDSPDPVNYRLSEKRFYFPISGDWWHSLSYPHRGYCPAFSTVD
jgi:hypothetical protein